MSNFEQEIEQKGEEEVKNKLDSGGGQQQGGDPSQQQQGGDPSQQQQGGDPNAPQDQGDQQQQQ